MQGVEVGAHREVTGEERLAHDRSELGNHAQAQVHPGLAAGELPGDFGDTQPTSTAQFVDETGFLQQVESVGTTGAQKSDDAADLVGAPGDEGHKAQVELASAAEAFEAVEKDGHRGVVNALEGFANALPGDRRQEAFLQAGLAEPMAFVT